MITRSMAASGDNKKSEEVLMSIKIPRKKRAPDGEFLYPLEKGDDEYNDLMQDMQISSDSSKAFSLAEDQIVNISAIENYDWKMKHYRHKMSSIEDENMCARATTFIGFVVITDPLFVEDIAENGLSVTHLDCSKFTHVLGHPEYGLHLFTSLQLALEHYEQHNDCRDRIQFLVCKVAVRKSRPTRMQPLSCDKEPMHPQPVFDHHLSDMSEISESANPKGSSLIYTYGFDEECDAQQRPHSVLPIAFVIFKYPKASLTPEFIMPGIKIQKPKKSSTENGTAFEPRVLFKTQTPIRPNAISGPETLPRPKSLKELISPNMLASIRARKQVSLSNSFSDNRILTSMFTSGLKLPPIKKVTKPTHHIDLDRVDDPSTLTNNFSENRMVRRYTNDSENGVTPKSRLLTKPSPTMAGVRPTFLLSAPRLESPQRFPRPPGALNLPTPVRPSQTPSLFANPNLPVATKFHNVENFSMRSRFAAAGMLLSIPTSHPRQTFDRACQANKRILNGLANGTIPYARPRLSVSATQSTPNLTVLRSGGVYFAPVAKRGRR